MTAQRTRGALALAAGAIVGAYAWFLGAWIIDDAGISFAYARSLAQGHGLVSQPGAGPVEGYSNLLWVLLVAALQRAGCFDPILTPKIAGLTLYVGAVFVVLAPFGRLPRGRLIAAGVAALLTALTPAASAWAVAGLENPLTMFLYAVLVRITHAAMRRNAGSASAVAAGGVAGLLALTRPEGALAALVHPLALWFARGPRRAFSRLTAVSIGVCALMVLGLLGFRLWHFEDFVPNTYWAKVKGHARPLLAALHVGAFVAATAIGARMLRRSSATRLTIAGFVLLVASLLVVLRAHTVTRALGNVVGDAVLGATVVALAARGVRGRIGRLPAAFAAALVVGMLAFWSLPRDWMGEYRFASPFVFVAWLALAAALPGRWLARLGRVPRLPLVAGIVLAVCAHAVALAQRARRFRDSTAGISMTAVAGDYQRTFARYAEILRLQRPSLLTIDLGGVLWVADMRVYDLGTLCDRVIARTLYTDTRGLHAYVFGEIKPTFLRIHGEAAALARFHLDPRFRRDYAAIDEQLSEDSTAGDAVANGRYVRRDALASDLDLELLRR